VNEIAHIKQGRAWPRLGRSGDGEKVVTTCEQGGHRVGCERSARECSPPPGLSLDDSLWLGRQLKNRSLLTLTQECQGHDLAVRKFQRIVMGCHPFFVDLPKDRCLVIDHCPAPSQQTGW
jgi:hypothetical protein